MSKAFRYRLATGPLCAAVMILLAVAGCSPDSAQTTVAPQLEKSADGLARLAAGEARVTRFRFENGTVRFEKAEIVVAERQSSGQAKSRSLSPSEPEREDAKRKISRDPLVQLLMSTAMKDAVLPMKNKYARSFSFRGARVVSSKKVGADNYTVESLALADSVRPREHLLLVKKNGQVMSARRIVFQSSQSSRPRAIVSATFNAKGQLDVLDLTEFPPASTAGADASAVAPKSGSVPARYAANSMACESEVLAVDAAMGAWLAIQIEIGLATAACEVTLWLCPAWVVLQEQAVAADIALAFAITLRDNCFHRVENYRTGGSFNSNGQFCYFSVYIETFDGGDSWSIRSVQEVCSGDEEYEL